MKLSIVMCTYNGVRFLRQQLDSIALQSRTPDEMIICDDGSIDKTLSILREFAGAVDFPVDIRCNASRLGAVNNFDQAISLAQGEIIVLSDQDDVWHHNKLEVIERILSENPDAGYAFSDAIVIDAVGKIIHHSLWELVSFDQDRREVFSSGTLGQVQTLSMGNVVTGATMAFWGSLKAKILPVPDQWIHDEWIAFASSLNGARGIPIENPLIYYRRHASQAIGVRLARSLPFLVGRAWQAFIGNPEAYEANELILLKWKGLRILLQSVNAEAAALLPSLEAKMAHLAFRAEMYRRPRFARLGAIVAEFRRGGYHHHAAGWKSITKDVLVPARKDRRPKPNV